MVIAQRAEEAKAIWVLGDLYRIRLSGEQTGGAYALIECKVSPGERSAATYSSSRRRDVLDC
jgi:hypothetical protein